MTPPRVNGPQTKRSRALRAVATTPAADTALRTIPIAAATARNLVAMANAQEQARIAYEAAALRFQDTFRTLLTEHGIAQAQPKEIRDTTPCSITVLVEALAEPEDTAAPAPPSPPASSDTGVRP